MNTELNQNKNGSTKVNSRTRKVSEPAANLDSEKIEYQLLSQRGLISSDTLKQQQQQIVAIARQMQQASGLDDLFKIVVTTIRSVLAVERVLIYQFDGDASGVVVKESVERGYTPAMRDGMPMVVFGYYQVTDYEQQSVIRFEDVETAELSPDQHKLWQQFQIKASLNFPLQLEGKVWGS